MDTLDVGKRIAQYVQIRDRIKEIEEEHKKRLAPLNEIQNLLSGAILGFLEASGQQKATSSTGETAYVTTRTTASLADPDEFMKFVIANKQFDLLDRRANATAVHDFMVAQKAEVPGVRLNTIKTVGVRRSPKGKAAAADAA